MSTSPRQLDLELNVENKSKCSNFPSVVGSVNDFKQRVRSIAMGFPCSKSTADSENDKSKDTHKLAMSIAGKTVTSSHVHPQPLICTGSTSCIPKSIVEVVRHEEEKSEQKNVVNVTGQNGYVSKYVACEQKPIATFPAIRSCEEAIESGDVALDDIMEGNLNVSKRKYSYFQLKNVINVFPNINDIFFYLMF